ncbi:MAG TPA: NnrS family protein [Sulfuricella sp.]|nr:NnrS family protein [Sulfuricella sp.]
MSQVYATWRAFSAAPHRMMFLAGAAQGVVAIVWWLVELLGRYTSVWLPPAWEIPSTWAHGFLMIYGFFPFFIFGFLMTTYPSWMNGAKVPPRRYVPASLLLAGGVLLFYFGLLAGKPLLIAGVMLMLGGWGIALYALFHVLITSRHSDKLHPKITSAALTAGWLGMLAYLWWLITGNALFVVFAFKAGIWFFLLPIFFTVGHRMIPFFSSRVLNNYRIVRPQNALWVMLVCSYGHGVLEIFGGNAWLWLFDLPLLAQAFYLSWHWQLRRSLEVRLLAVLHIAFAWLSVALALYVVQSLALLADRPILGFAPLHALTIGLFASMVLGMASRVTLGHSGGELKADGVTWGLFLGFQFAALARIGGDLPLAGGAAGHFYLLAAAIWLACFAPWFVKYAPKFWRPRSDGQPG